MATKRALFPDEPDHVLEFVPLPVANHTPLTHKAGMRWDGMGWVVGDGRLDQSERGVGGWIGGLSE